MSEITIYLRSATDPHTAVMAFVEVHYGRVSGQNRSTVLETAQDGAVHLTGVEDIQFLMINPRPGYWKVLLQDWADGAAIAIPPINAEQAGHWRRFCGVPDEPPPSKVRIGVIDAGFQPSDRFGDLRMVSEREAADLPPESHGRRVAGLIGARGTDGLPGVCPEVELVFADVTYVEGEDAGARELWNTEEVIDAVDRLSEEFSCDVINISGGMPDGASRLLEAAIWRAVANGVLVLAASGNDPGREVAFPARLPAVIGVGGLGLRGVAPIGTYARLTETKAVSDGMAGDCPRGFGVYLDLGKSVGDGVNVLAPSIGLPFTIHDGIVMDLDGTSYACPIVAGLLGHDLGRDPVFQAAEGRARGLRARERLIAMCLDVGLPHDKQGHGAVVYGSHGK